ncbi:hypothetical protein CW750_08425 [Latilactobacillus sakei]|uniref:hypothetical protein n=1 Tax=Latilactobacillus sakei TaxID=1599 RepID=UPI000DCAAEEB|nr:hypothetical protein [Latilactobacillus sakei]AWZ43128.1 hypothetical protein CW750_08425 [Latilactobacillus sakei]
MKKIKIFIKKHYILGSLVALILTLIVAPKLIELLLQSIPGTGSNDGWLGFWGGYLGSVIAVAFAAYTAKLQSEKAIDEHRRAELFVYQDKTKLDRIFKIQEDLAEIDIKCRYLFGMEVYQDAVDDKTVIAQSIDEINGKIEEVNSKMERLQFYFREGEDGREKCKEIIGLVNKGKEIVINKDEELSTNDVDGVRDVVKKYRESYIDEQIDNMNELLKIVNDSIQAK